MAKTLLLADDSVTIQRVIELTFADEDIRVVAVSDGDQAIARVIADPPDIVLADVGMPGKNGYEVAQYIKQTPSLAHIPVVLLTGAFEPVDQARATAAGCDGVLAKPFEPQLVIGRVKELLARSRDAVASLDVDLAPPAGTTIESYAPPLVDSTFGADLIKPVESAQGDYFDRLDEAFANLGTGPQSASKRAAAAPVADTDWFSGSARPATGEVDDGLSIGPIFADDPADDLPLAPAPAARLAQPVARPTVAPPSRPPFVQPVQAMPAQTAPVHATPAQAAHVQAATVPAPRPSAPVPPPPIAETFAALLAAELKAPAPAVAPVWPTRPPAESIDTDALVEQVVERVLARLSDRVVRETVAEIIAKVADRLVREEIDRIKESVE